jgi:hypothetical protein
VCIEDALADQVDLVAVAARCADTRQLLAVEVGVGVLAVDVRQGLALANEVNRSLELDLVTVAEGPRQGSPPPGS